MKCLTVAILGIILVFSSVGAQGQESPRSEGPAIHVDPSYLADIHLKNGKKLENNYIQFITEGGKLRAKAKDEYSPDYVTRNIPLADVKQIVFPGGDPNNKGVVLTSGHVAARLLDYKSGKWRFALLPEDSGELVVTDKKQVLSVNLVDKTIAPRDPSLRNMDVLEWIYQNDPIPFGQDNNWTMDIKKVSLASNAIILTADVWSADTEVSGGSGCALVCKAEDNEGHQYEPIYSPDFFKVPPKKRPNTIQIQCPTPGNDVDSITVSIRSLSDRRRPPKLGQPANPSKRHGPNDFWGDKCRGDQWIALPSIPMKKLRAGTLAE